MLLNIAIEMFFPLGERVFVKQLCVVRINGENVHKMQVRFI